MTRVDQEGIPCIVQSIEFNCGMATVTLFDDTIFTTFEFSDNYNRAICESNLFMAKSEEVVNLLWNVLYSSVEAWAGYMFSHRFTDKIATQEIS